MDIMFKSQGAFKYGCGLLETVIQSYVLPESLSASLAWNRTFNLTGKIDSNIGKWNISSYCIMNCN